MIRKELWKNTSNFVFVTLPKEGELPTLGEDIDEKEKEEELDDDDTWTFNNGLDI